MVDILRVAKHGASKTRIRNTAGLVNSNLNHYLNLLLSLGLLEEGNSYHTTQKGLEFIKSFENLQKTLASQP